MAGDAITTPAHSRSLSLLWSSGGLPCLPVEGAAFGEPSQRLDQPPRGPDRIAAVLHPMIRLGWVISKLVVHVWLLGILLNLWPPFTQYVLVFRLPKFWCGAVVGELGSPGWVASLGFHPG